MKANRMLFTIFVLSLVTISFLAWDQYRNAVLYKRLAVDSIIARGGQLVAINRLMLKHDCPDDQKHLIWILARESLERIQANERFILEAIPEQEKGAYRQMVGDLDDIVMNPHGTGNRNGDPAEPPSAQ
jgi:hypothetical protein